LVHAQKTKFKVQLVFVFDASILDKLEDRNDARVSFIHQTLTKINQSLAGKSGIDVYHGLPTEAHLYWQQKYNVKAIYTNQDYEPYGIERDETISQFWATKGVDWYAYKDQCIFEKQEVLSNSGTPYTVFTPYSNKWKSLLNPYAYKAYPTEKYFEFLNPAEELRMPTLAEIGFQETKIQLPSGDINDEVIKHYTDKRNFPSLDATSRLGIHLRFGTLSIRKLTKHAVELNDTFLNELIWRDFYINLLYHFPAVGKGASFKPAYERIIWRNNEAEFEAWCEGKTGYPIVDAGMRQLNATGFMHNRVRMIVASFLCKHLLIDWRWGEAYFAQKLLDFDLSSNNGGWQWAAGCGADAAPYFRVFNPTLQTQKFDADLKYIKKWVPEFPNNYVQPIVQHEFARKRCLDTYSIALKGIPS
jgi:deoxyribodipyrimidine photo-lyase